MYSDGTPVSKGRSKGDKAKDGLLYVTSLLAFALLVVVIWLGVENKQRRDDILALSRHLTVANPQANTVNLFNNASTGADTAIYPNTYLSQNSTTQTGYINAGSLYRGSGYWAQQNPLDTPRADFVLLNLNESLYLFGGHDANGTYLSDGAFWSVPINQTNVTATMPSARSHYGAATIDNSTIYIVGGYSSEINETNNIPEACNLVYNVSGDSWSSGACLNEARGVTCTVAVNGSLYTIGGVSSNGSQLSSVEVFNPSTNAWMAFANLPSGRSGVGCAASNNNIIVAGGTYGNGTDLSEVWAIDSSSASLTRLADLPEAKFELSLVSLPGGDVLSVSGGQNVNSSELATHNVERYSAVSNLWVEKAQISNQRFGFGAALADEGVYALGGHTFCADTNSEDCESRILAATEIFYDSDHPDIFVYIQNPAASLIGPVPNTSQVLLLNQQSGVNGYTNAGSLYRGSGYWAQGASLPQALSDLLAVPNGDTVFILGGLDSNAQEGPTVVDTLYEYDPVLDSYTTLANLPEPRTRGGAALLGGLVYYVAGYTNFDELDGPSDSLLIYNISSNTWTRSNATLSSPRSDVCMSAVNGTLIVAGGYSLNYTETLSLAEMYDPDTDQWTAIPSMPTPRGDVMCSTLEGQFVAAGGFWDPSNQFTPASQRNEVQAYSPGSGEWTSLAPLPVARGDAAMTTIPSTYGDRLLVVGGENNLDNERTGIATHQVQEYSSGLDEWILKAPMINPRFRHAITYASGNVIVFGGASSSLCGSDGFDCTLRPVASVDQFFDTDDPDIFVYTAES